MKTTIPKLRQILRRVIVESLRDMSDDEIIDMANRGGHKDGGRSHLKARDREIALDGMSDEEAAMAAMDRSSLAQKDYDYALDSNRALGRIASHRAALKYVADQVAKGKY